MSAEAYDIRRRPTLPLVAAWRAQPHVRQWWAEPADDLAADTIGDPDITVWIAELDGRPIAFIQDYRSTSTARITSTICPPGSRGIDIFIGDADLLGHGHGAHLVRQHVDGMFARRASAAGIDPHPENAAARRAYAKAGFTTVSGPLDARWGRAVLMERRAEA